MFKLQFPAVFRRIFYWKLPWAANFIQKTFTRENEPQKLNSSPLIQVKVANFSPIKHKTQLFTLKNLKKKSKIVLFPTYINIGSNKFIYLLIPFHIMFIKWWLMGFKVQLLLDRSSFFKSNFSVSEIQALTRKLKIQPQFKRSCNLKPNRSSQNGHSSEDFNHFVNFSSKQSIFVIFSLLGKSILAFFGLIYSTN